MVVSAVLEYESDLATEIELTVDELFCRCPVNGKRDAYSVRVRYAPAGHVVELGHLREWLDGHRGAAITHENLTRDLADMLVALLAPAWLRVETIWEPVEGVACTVRVVGGE